MECSPDKKMPSLEESIARALDTENTAILSHIPYILQDFWELGTSPAIMAELIRKYSEKTIPSEQEPQTAGQSVKVLDLGCGKGAVSCRLAQELSCRCLGIDGMGEFIREAEGHARRLGVEKLCVFETGDVRTKIQALPAGAYDFIILGAIGRVFGDYYETLSALKNYVSPTGRILVDDAWVRDENETHEGIFQKEEILRQASRAGFHLEEGYILDFAAFPAPAGSSPTGLSTEHELQMQNIRRRCEERMRLCPADKDIIAEYCANQEREYYALETSLVPVILSFVRQPAEAQL